MSSIVKKMLIRSTSEVYAERVLVKHKYVHHNQIDSLRVNRRPSVHVSRSSCRVWHTRCQELNISANGFSHLTPKKREQLIGSRLRAKAILTPVTDPTPTTKKGRWKQEGSHGMYIVKALKMYCISCKRERECVMCLSEEMSVVFLPCAHQVVCTTCNELHEKQGMKECPSCRGPIQRRISVRHAHS